MAEEIKKEEQTPEETKVEETKVEKVKPEPKKEKASKKTKEVEIPKHLKKFVEEIEQMKLVDLAELVKILEEKFGVSAAPVAIAAAPASAAPAEGGGKSLFNVVLTAAGDKKNRSN